MRIAHNSPALFDFMGEISSLMDVVERNVADFSYIANVDTSKLSDKSVPLDSVYTRAQAHGKITIMSIFRKDLFLSVTLPVCAVVCGAYVFTWTSFTRVDDANKAILQSISEQVKSQAVSTEQISNLTKLQQDTNSKLDKVADQLGTLNTSLEVFKESQKQRPESG